jgi:predicted permease
LPAAKYRGDSKVAVVFDQLISRLEALPGVKGAATVNVLPIIGGNTSRIIVEGKPIPPPGEETEVNLRDASARYFRTMGVPVLRGRDFGVHDNRQAPMVVIVNQTLADRILPGEDPIGRRVIFSGDDRTPVEIVGVVGDERVNGLDANVTPVVYYPFLQELSRTTSLVVRTGTDPNSLASAIRHEALSVEPDLSIYGVMTMEELIANSPATFVRRYPAMLIGLFAVLALVLAATGLYGVISYSVSQQTREVGIRLALGASPRDILKLVIGRGLALTIGGLGTGLVVALVVTRFLSTLLFGVSATDPAVFASLALLLGCVALLACFVPARRATRVDPLRALRYE